MQQENLTHKPHSTLWYNKHPSTVCFKANILSTWCLATHTDTKLMTFFFSSVVASYVAVEAQTFMCTSQPLVALCASCYRSTKNISFLFMLAFNHFQIPAAATETTPLSYTLVQEWHKQSFDCLAPLGHVLLPRFPPWELHPFVEGVPASLATFLVATASWAPINLYRGFGSLGCFLHCFGLGSCCCNFFGRCCCRPFETFSTTFALLFFQRLKHLFSQTLQGLGLQAVQLAELLFVLVLHSPLWLALARWAQV